MSDLQARLSDLESEVDRGIELMRQGWQIVSINLATIRDEKLYRQSGAANFLEYVEERFGIGKSHVYRLLSAIEYVDALPSPDKWSESAVRELSRIGPARTAGGSLLPATQCKTFERARAVAAQVESESDGAMITAKAVRTRVDAILSPPSVKTPNGQLAANKHDDASAAALRRLQARVDEVYHDLAWVLWNCRSLVEEFLESHPRRSSDSDETRIIRRELENLDIGLYGPLHRSLIIDDILSQKTGERRSSVNLPEICRRKER